MRFVKSSKSPYVLLYKNVQDDSLDLYNNQCHKIVCKLTEISTLCDSDTFPNEKFKELIQLLVDLKKIKIPKINLNLEVLHSLSSKSIEQFIDDEIVVQNTKKEKKEEIDKLENDFFEKIQEIDMI